MIYHVTRKNSHHVVTVNADTAQDAARIAVNHRGISDWEGEYLLVYEGSNSYKVTVPYEQAKTVVVGAAA